MDRDSTLDQVLREIVDIRRLLEEMPRAAYEQRATLRSRLAELRALAAAMPSRPTDREELRLYLRRLEMDLERRLGTHLSQSAAAQTGLGGGIDPKFVHRLNRQLDESLGVDELKDEIRRVRTLLTDD